MTLGRSAHTKLHQLCSVGSIISIKPSKARDELLRELREGKFDYSEIQIERVNVHTEIRNILEIIKSKVTPPSFHQLRMDKTFNRFEQALSNASSVGGVQNAKGHFLYKLRRQLKRINKANALDYAVIALELGLETVELTNSFDDEFVYRNLCTVRVGGRKWQT